MSRRSPPRTVELEWIEPLLWADPPFALVQQLLRQARKTAGLERGDWETVRGWSMRARWQRRVHKELGRLLKAARIYVEGE